MDYAKVSYCIIVINRFGITRIKMSYDLHITRRKDWAQSDNNIEADAWLAYVESDATLHLQPDNGPYFVLWMNSDQPESSESDWLDWSEGQLYSKYPSSSFRKKMFAIADDLGAVVQGDEGELYDAYGEETGNEADVDDVDNPHEVNPPKSLWCTLKTRLQRISFRHPLGTPYCIEPLWFNEGDTVLDSWGNEQIIVKIDRKAFHGEGLILTKNEQGNESTVTLQSYRTFKEPLI